MLKKLDNFLLINYPLLWNTRIVYVLIFALLINFCFYFIGYSINSLSPKYFQGFPSFLISVLCAFLSGALWLILYSRNNPQKSNYPSSYLKALAEWIITFIIILSFALYPFSLYMGGQYKIQSYASEECAKKNVEMLEGIKILLPANTKHSLLDEYCSNEAEVKVKLWLQVGERDSIKQLMSDFIRFQRDNNLATNLNVDNWYKIIYNPPQFYPDRSIEVLPETETYDSSESHYYCTSYYYVQSYWDTIYNSYTKTDDRNEIVVICLYCAFIISFLIFIFRYTSGKAWLIAYISIFTYFLISVFLSIFVDNNFEEGDVSMFILCMILLYFIISLSLFSKKVNKGIKGHPSVFIALITTIPALCFVLYFICILFEIDSVYEKIKYHELEGLILNFVYMLFSMPLVIALTRKWISLPEA